MTAIERQSQTDVTPHHNELGRATAEYAAELYHLLSPDLGIILFEPNIVLGLAGIRAYAWNNIGFEDDRLETAVHEFQHMNNQIIKKGILFGPKATYHNSAMTIDLWNFRGLEDITHKTSIPEVPEFIFRESSALEDVQHWFSGFKNSSKGNVTLNGIRLGYPDIAITDFRKYYPKQDSFLEYVHIQTSVAQSDCEAPNFMVHVDHVQHPTVVSYIKNAEAVLHEFYSNKYVQSIRMSSGYTDAVAHSLLLQEQGMQAVREFHKKQNKRFFEIIPEGTPFEEIKNILSHDPQIVRQIKKVLRIVEKEENQQFPSRNVQLYRPTVTEVPEETPIPTEEASSTPN